MALRQYQNQSELDADLKELFDVFEGSPCELVKGELPDTNATNPADDIDPKLRNSVLKQLSFLEAEEDKPRIIFYQLPTGQQVMICFAISVEGKLLVGYRDVNSRPPTGRVKATVNAAINLLYDND